MGNFFEVAVTRAIRLEEREEALKKGTFGKQKMQITTTIPAWLRIVIEEEHVHINDLIMMGYREFTALSSRDVMLKKMAFFQQEIQRLNCTIEELTKEMIKEHDTRYMRSTKSDNTS